MFRNVISGFSEFSTNDGNGPTTHSGYFSQTDNPNLEMEKMKNLNVGFETALLDKSLFIDVSYFRTNYTDQITKRSNYYPAFISTYIPYENYNQTSYSGIDASLKYKKKFGDFYIESGINLLYSTSEYIKLDEIHNNNYQYLVGKPTDSYWGLTNLGFFNTDAEAKAANQRFGSIRRGDIHYVDNDGNGFIDDNDKTTIGNWSPRVTGDLNLSVAFKGFCLFVTANMQLGYDWMMSSDYFWIDGNKKYSEMALNRWTDATAETATYPRLSAQTSQNNFRASDFWIVNGNSISLSRVQMNYSMPSKLFNNLFIKGISVYLRGSDLLLLAENARLRQTNSYVSSRNFSLGLKIRY